MVVYDIPLVYRGGGPGEERVAGRPPVGPKIDQKSKWADLYQIRWDIVKYEVPALLGLNKGV